MNISADAIAMMMEAFPGQPPCLRVDGDDKLYKFILENDGSIRLWINRKYFPLDADLSFGKGIFSIDQMERIKKILKFEPREQRAKKPRKKYMRKVELPISVLSYGLIEDLLRDEILREA
jgi:hypothetical protein